MGEDDILRVCVMGERILLSCGEVNFALDQEVAKRLSKVLAEQVSRLVATRRALS